VKSPGTLRYSIIIVLAVWLMFWWGHYVGELNATGAWLATERNDLQALLLLKRVVDADPAATQVLAAQIDAKKTEVHQLEEAKKFSVIHFALFPVLGPIRWLALATL
jgi:hypothetical protein